MPGKTKLSSYCIVRDSEKLQTLIKMKMQQRGVGPSELAEFIGTDRSGVSKYLLHSEHSISQQKLLSIAAYLGISVDLQIEVAE